MLNKISPFFIIIYTPHKNIKKSIKKQKQALMSQFAIVTSEGWTEIMYDTMKEMGKGSSASRHLYTYFMPIYFMFSHMFGSLVNKINK